MEKIEKYNSKLFESIKHIDENDKEYWCARELMIVLEYKKWQKFREVINKAIVSYKTNNNNVSDHFTHVGKMIDTAKGAKREIEDYHLSRYACYLIAQNGDVRKKVIAAAQAYFIVKTRTLELLEESNKKLSEDEKRLIERRKVRSENYSLNQTAKESGVKNLAEFHNAGYKGLYNGETADDIFKRKKLRYREDILDNMGSEELVDNWFRIIHTEAKLKREKIDNQYDANATHYNVGREIRKIIKKFGNDMPEDLPTPKTSIKEIEKCIKNKE